MREQILCALVVGAALTFAIIQAATVHPVPPPKRQPVCLRCEREPLSKLAAEHSRHSHAEFCHGPEGPGRVS